MEIIKFEKTQNHYFMTNAPTIHSMLLGGFLINDVQAFPLNWIQWANDPLKPYTSSNTSIIVKNDNKIFIYDLLCEDENGGPYFETTREQFITLLEDWDQMLKQMPSVVYLTIDDNGIITLEASND